MIILLLGLVSKAYATAGEGFYFGGNMGYTNTNNGTGTGSSGKKTTGFGGGILGGYNMNLYSAIEMGLTHFGTTNPSGAPSIYVNSFNFLILKLKYPLGDFGVFAKGGLSALNQVIKGKNVKRDSTTRVRPGYGAGISYELTQNWVADLSYYVVTAGSHLNKAEIIALGINYQFVDKFCGQFLCG